MKNTINIDPGPTQSAFLIWNGQEILQMGIWDNKDLMQLLDIDDVTFEFETGIPDALIIEKIVNMGMPAVGDSIFETAYWSGIFAHAYGVNYTVRIPQRDVRMHLCGSMRAKPANIRQALINRFEPDLEPRQRCKGFLKEVGKADDHKWAALALAVTWWDQHAI